MNLTANSLIRKIEQEKSQGNNRAWFYDPRVKVYVHWGSKNIKLGSIDIEPQFQRKGIGTIILTGLMDYAKKNDKGFVIECCNEKSGALAQKLGLVKDGDNYIMLY